MSSQENLKEKRKTTVGYALLVVGVIFGTVVVGNIFFGLSMQVLFIWGWLLAFFFCMFLGYTYKELENNFYNFMKKSVLSLTFMLIIGGMSGVWNACGTIAAVTHAGLGLISPSFYQFSAFLICLLFSFVTGTSWGTAGTAGVALMGVGLGLGLSPAQSAAPILSAAFIGDMSSPLSDSPNLISAFSGVNLMEHIRHQLRLIIPGIIIIASIYFVVGFNNDSVTVSINEINVLREAIASNFRLGFLPLIPLIIVVVCLLRKVPTVLAVLCSTFSGVLIAWGYQGTPLADVMTSIWKGFSIASGNTMVDSLFSRGGVTSMASSAFTALIVTGLFGILSTAGIFEVLTMPIMTKATTSFRANIVSVGLSLFTTLGGSTGFPIFFIGETVSDVYRKRGFNLLDLTSAISVGGLLFATIIPWHANLLPPASYLGVEPGDVFSYMFMPWAFLASSNLLDA